VRIRIFQGEWGPAPAERRERSRRAQRLGLVTYVRSRSARRPWAPEELTLLGTLPDVELAVRLGRTPSAVRGVRAKRGIPTARDRRRKPGFAAR